MAELKSYGNYEYAITIGEGKLLSYGIADPTIIRTKVIDALMSYGNVSVHTNVAIDTTETGKFMNYYTDQVCA